MSAPFSGICGFPRVLATAGCKQIVQQQRERREEGRGGGGEGGQRESEKGGGEGEQGERQRGLERDETRNALQPRPVGVTKGTLEWWQALQRLVEHLKRSCVSAKVQVTNLNPKL